MQPFNVLQNKNKFTFPLTRAGLIALKTDTEIKNKNETIARNVNDISHAIAFASIQGKTNYNTSLSAPMYSLIRDEIVAGLKINFPDVSIVLSETTNIVTIDWT
jgi:hypothetical protein